MSAPPASANQRYEEMDTEALQRFFQVELRRKAEAERQASEARGRASVIREILAKRPGGLSA